jgi:ketosteroid isomerase-like protein
MRKTLTIALCAVLLSSSALAKDKGETKETKEVRGADTAFAAAARARDLEKFLSFVDDDVHFFVDGKMVTGKDKERENWTKTFADKEVSIVWKPELAEASGGLGYTSGGFEIRKAGKLQRKGRYATVWRRKPDGSWKVALDIATSEPPVEEKKK